MPHSYLTPLNDDYHSCERTKAVFRIHCGTRSPSSITELLQIEPSEIVQIGVPKALRSGRIGPIGKVNLWMLDSENHVQSKDLRRHLSWVLSKVQPAAQRIVELRQSDVLIDMWCVWWSNGGDGGPAISPDQMRRMADLDVELSIGFSSYSDDD